MEHFNVEFYESPDGTYPAEAFIQEQDTKMQAKLYRLIELLEMEGNRLGLPYSRPLQDGIYELRAQQGSNATRLLYFFVIGRRVILTNGFVKKTRKTPHGEIEIARKRRDDFLTRKDAL